MPFCHWEIRKRLARGGKFSSQMDDIDNPTRRAIGVSAKFLLTRTMEENSSFPRIGTAFAINKIINLLIFNVLQIMVAGSAKGKRTLETINVKIIQKMTNPFRAQVSPTTTAVCSMVVARLSHFGEFLFALGRARARSRCHGLERCAKKHCVYPCPCLVVGFSCDSMNQEV